MNTYKVFLADGVVQTIEAEKAAKRWEGSEYVLGFFVGEELIASFYTARIVGWAKVK